MLEKKNTNTMVKTVNTENSVLLVYAEEEQKTLEELITESFYLFVKQELAKK